MITAGAMFFLFFSCIFSSSVQAATNPADASALNVMYQSLNSPYQLTKWSSSGGDPCGESWKGVTCSGLAVTEIVLSGLGLSGSMGYQLASLTSVINFDVSNNNLDNQLPYQLPPNLQRLDIAGNGFNGSLPYSISLMTSLKYLNVSHNQFQYQLTDMFNGLVALSTLDLSFNLLLGMLPTSFSSLSSVTSMYLQNNQFTGTIDVLANLPLKNLNVANNRFTGWIPQQLTNINIQKDGNSWSSEASPPPPPPGTPPFSQTSPPPNSGNSNIPSNYGGTGGGGSGGKKSSIGGGGIAGVVLTFFTVGTILAVILMKRRSRATTSDEEKDHQPFAPLVFSNKGQGTKAFKTSLSVGTKTFKSPGSINLSPPPLDRNKTFDDEDFRKKPVLTKKSSIARIDAKSYSVADLQIATKSFSTENLIGEGSFGRVYRAQFDGGKVLAVKKISMSVLSDSEDFIGIVLNMSKLDHPNVTKLVGYCSEHGQHLLVHVFHKNGSLHDFLHLPDEHSKPLSWNSRVRIALGTARALEYLHEVCSPSVVHKNFISANILLGKDLSPHLADCGLASFLPNADQEAGSGYSAPEATTSGIYTLKSDIYSFGVVMLELLTGRKPFDSSRQRGEQSLVGWATPQLHDIDALAKMVDPSLEGLYQVKSLSRFADVIALCVQSEPEFRPPMSEVVQALVRLVQRAKMGKTAGTKQAASQLGENPDYK